MTGELLERGQRDGYFWLFGDVGELDGILDHSSELVVGKTVVVTATDSGPFRLSRRQREAGWSAVRDLSICSAVESVVDLPRCGFDEWYVFESDAPDVDIEVFVNLGGFGPEDLEDRPYWKHHVERFWEQIVELQPALYFGEGACLLLLTRDEELAERCWRYATSVLEWTAAIDLVARSALLELSAIARGEMLESMVYEDWRGDPNWARLSQPVRKALSEESADNIDVGSAVYDDALLLPLRSRLAKASREYLLRQLEDSGYGITRLKGAPEAGSAD